MKEPQTLEEVLKMGGVPTPAAKDFKRVPAAPATLEDVLAMGGVPTASAKPVPAKPTEATLGDILSRFGSPTGQPETVMEKLRRATTKEPGVVTGSEPTGNPVIDILRSVFSLEGAVPSTAAVKGVKAIVPTAAKAGAKFDQVMAAAKNVRLDTSALERIAGEVEKLSEAGGVLPKPVRDFIKMHTDSVPVTYKTGRDFAMNAADKAMSLKKAGKKNMARLVTEFATAMKTANRGAAAEVGMGKVYDQAMREYHLAKTIEEKGKIIAKWALISGLGSGGLLGLKKLID